VSSICQVRACVRVLFNVSSIDCDDYGAQENKKTFIFMTRGKRTELEFC